MERGIRLRGCPHLSSVFSRTHPPKAPDPDQCKNQCPGCGQNQQQYGNSGWQQKNACQQNKQKGYFAGRKIAGYKACVFFHAAFNFFRSLGPISDASAGKLPMERKGLLKFTLQQSCGNHARNKLFAPSQSPAKHRVKSSVDSPFDDSSPTGVYWKNPLEEFDSQRPAETALPGEVSERACPGNSIPPKSCMSQQRLRRKRPLQVGLGTRKPPWLVRPFTLPASLLREGQAPGPNGPVRATSLEELGHAAGSVYNVPTFQRSPLPEASLNSMRKGPHLEAHRILNEFRAGRQGSAVQKRVTMRI